jgi:hypothetical protein
VWIVYLLFVQEQKQTDSKATADDITMLRNCPNKERIEFTESTTQLGNQRKSVLWVRSHAPLTEGN